MTIVSPAQYTAAIRTQPGTCLAYAWPAKEPQDTATYILDATAWLALNGFTLNSATVSASGGISAIVVATLATGVRVQVSGGLPSTVATVFVTLVVTDGYGLTDQFNVSVSVPVWDFYSFGSSDLVPTSSVTVTPTLMIGSSAATATFTQALLRYSAMAPEVTFLAAIQWTGLTPASGAVTIAGLPVAAISAGSPQVTVAGYGITPSSGGQIYGLVQPSGNIAIVSDSGGAPGSDAPLDGAALGAAGGIFVSGFYFTA